MRIVIQPVDTLTTLLNCTSRFSINISNLNGNSSSRIEYIQRELKKKIFAQEIIYKFHSTSCTKKGAPNTWFFHGTLARVRLDRKLIFIALDTQLTKQKRNLIQLFKEIHYDRILILQYECVCVCKCVHAIHRIADVNIESFVVCSFFINMNLSSLLGLFSLNWVFYKHCYRLLGY